MKSRITTKLFVAIFGTSLFAAMALAVSAHIGFTRGFLGYLNEQGVVRMESILPKLTDAYRDHGNWDFLRDDARVWFYLLRPPGPPDALASERVVIPPDIPEPDLTGIFLRVTLLDTQGQYVTGQPNLEPDSIRRPVIVDGALVGYLALVPFERASGAANMLFQQRQLHATLIIFGVTALVAALVAFLLARTLLKPVKRIAHATGRLAAGEYTTRVKVASHDEIGRLAEDFNRLALALEKNEQMRRGFMADVSHELRTPLSVLRGELEALEDGIRPITSESVKSLQGEVGVLSKLVEDLYDLSLSDVGALSYRLVEVDVLEVLRTSIASVRDRFEQRYLRIALDLPSTPLLISGDESRLRQLFSNLLENTLRYADAGASVRIAGAGNAVHARIVIEDSGPGVADDVLPKLFDRFYRTESSRNRARGGAGLGLAICRNIVEAHAGTIEASASPLGGLRIAVDLPLVVQT